MTFWTKKNQYDLFVGVKSFFFHLPMFRAAFPQYMWPVCQTRYTSREKYPRKTPFFDTIWVLFVDVSKTPKGSDMVGHGRTFRSLCGHTKVAVIQKWYQQSNQTIWLFIKFKQPVQTRKCSFCSVFVDGLTVTDDNNEVKNGETGSCSTC